MSELGNVEGTGIVVLSQDLHNVSVLQKPSIFTPLGFTVAHNCFASISLIDCQKLWGFSSELITVSHAAHSLTFLK